MFKMSSYLGTNSMKIFIIVRNGKTSSYVTKRFMATLFFCEQTNLKAG